MFYEIDIKNQTIIKDIEMLPDKLKEVFWTEAESNYKIYKNSFMLKIMKEKQKETQK